MHPNLLFADIAAARNRDLLVEAKQHRRAGLSLHGRSVEGTVRATARWVVQRWTIRGIPESVAA